MRKCRRIFAMAMAVFYTMFVITTGMVGTGWIGNDIGKKVEAESPKVNLTWSLAGSGGVISTMIKDNMGLTLPKDYVVGDSTFILNREAASTNYHIYSITCDGKELNFSYSGGKYGGEYEVEVPAGYTDGQTAQMSVEFIEGGIKIASAYNEKIYDTIGKFDVYSVGDAVDTTFMEIEDPEHFASIYLTGAKKTVSLSSSDYSMAIASKMDDDGLNTGIGVTYKGGDSFTSTYYVGAKASLQASLVSAVVSQGTLNLTYTNIEHLDSVYITFSKAAQKCSGTTSAWYAKQDTLYELYKKGSNTAALDGNTIKIDLWYGTYTGVIKYYADKSGSEELGNITSNPYTFEITPPAGHYTNATISNAYSVLSGVPTVKFNNYTDFKQGQTAQIGTCSEVVTGTTASTNGIFTLDANMKMTISPTATIGAPGSLTTTFTKSYWGLSTKEKGSVSGKIVMQIKAVAGAITNYSIGAAAVDGAGKSLSAGIPSLSTTSTVAGDTVTVTPNSVAGYALDAVTVTEDSSGTVVQSNSSGNTFSFTMPAANVTVKAVYKKSNTITASATCDSGETLAVPTIKNADGTVISEAATGETVTVEPSATIKLGDTAGTYVLDSVTYNGSLASPTGSKYKFIMPEGVVNVVANYKKNYSITTEGIDEEGLAVTALAPTTNVGVATKGTTITITPKENESYKFSSIKIIYGNTVITPTKSSQGYAFTMPASDVKVSVSYMKNYTLSTSVKGVTADAPSVTADNQVAAVAYKGQSIKVTPVTVEDYDISSVIVKNAATQATITTTNSGGVWSFTMPEANVTIEVTYEKCNYTLTVNSDCLLLPECNALTITKTGDSGKVRTNKQVTFTLDSDFGGAIVCTPTCTIESGANNTYSFTMPKANVTVDVKYNSPTSATITAPTKKSIDVGLGEWTDKTYKDLDVSTGAMTFSFANRESVSIPLNDSRISLSETVKSSDETTGICVRTVTAAYKDLTNNDVITKSFDYSVTKVIPTSAKVIITGKGNEVILNADDDQGIKSIEYSIVGVHDVTAKASGSCANGATITLPTGDYGFKITAYAVDINGLDGASNTYTHSFEPSYMGSDTYYMKVGEKITLPGLSGLINGTTNYALANASTAISLSGNQVTANAVTSGATITVGGTQNGRIWPESSVTQKVITIVVTAPEVIIKKAKVSISSNISNANTVSSATGEVNVGETVRITPDSTRKVHDITLNGTKVSDYVPGEPYSYVIKESDGDGTLTFKVNYYNTLTLSTKPSKLVYQDYELKVGNAGYIGISLYGAVATLSVSGDATQIETLEGDDIGKIVKTFSYVENATTATVTLTYEGCTTSYPVDVIVDNKEPDITVSLKDTMLYIEASDGDDGSGMKTLSYQIDGETAVVSASALQASVDIANYAGKKITIIGVDNRGNEKKVEKTYTVVGVPDIQANSKTISMEVGKTAKLEFSNLEADAKLLYSTSNSTIANVALDGTISALQEGTATISVKYTQNGVTGTLTAKVTVTRTPAPVLKESAYSMNAGDTQSDLWADTDGVTQFEYKSANAKIADVVDGKLVAVSAGTTTITASFTYNNQVYDDYVITVTVYAAEVETVFPVVQQTSLSMVEGEKATIQYNSSSEYSKGMQFAYKSNNQSVASVDEDGEITAVAEGKTTIDITYSCNGKSDSATVTVVVSGKSIVVVPTVESTTIEVAADGTSKIVVDASKADEGVTVSFDSKNKEIATVDSQGNVNPVVEGKAVITVTYSYNGVVISTENVTVTVKLPQKTDPSESKDPAGGSGSAGSTTQATNTTEVTTQTQEEPMVLASTKIKYAKKSAKKKGYYAIGCKKVANASGYVIWIANKKNGKYVKLGYTTSDCFRFNKKVLNKVIRKNKKKLKKTKAFYVYAVAYNKTGDKKTFAKPSKKKQIKLQWYK